MLIWVTSLPSLNSMQESRLFFFFLLALVFCLFGGGFLFVWFVSFWFFFLYIRSSCLNFFSSYVEHYFVSLEMWESTGVLFCCIELTSLFINKEANSPHALVCFSIWFELTVSVYMLTYILERSFNPLDVCNSLLGFGRKQILLESVSPKLLTVNVFCLYSSFNGIIPDYYKL